MDNTRLVEGNPYFEAVAFNEGFYSPALMERLAEKGSLHDIEGIVPDWVKELFVTSHDISPEWHVRMQAAFQEHTDNAVSKTINFPASATVQDVADAYMLAYESGCKGITIYRDGSKDGQVLSTGDAGEKKEDEEKERPASSHLTPRVRPQEMTGVTERVRTGHGNMYVTINFDDERSPFEVFTTLGKAGGCDSAQLEAISRLVSLALRSGIDIEDVIRQLKGITCCPAWDNGTLVRSAPDAVALALEKRAVSVDPESSEVAAAQLKLFANINAQTPDATTPTNVNGMNGNGHQPRSRCPDCNAPLAYQEGCLLCTACGWNKCG
jgi:ribonucleoside-diphosphate reductase alpha chain